MYSYCSKCGKSVDSGVEVKKPESETTSSSKVQPGQFRGAVVFLMIISILANFIILPYNYGPAIGLISACVSLFWSIPTTIHVSSKYNSAHRIGTGFKVCVLLFVSVPAGILLLCDRQEDVQ